MNNFLEALKLFSIGAGALIAFILVISLMVMFVFFLSETVNRVLKLDEGNGFGVLCSVMLLFFGFVWFGVSQDKKRKETCVTAKIVEIGGCWDRTKNRQAYCAVKLEGGMETTTDHPFLGDVETACKWEKVK